MCAVRKAAVTHSVTHSIAHSYWNLLRTNLYLFRFRRDFYCPHVAGKPEQCGQSLYLPSFHHEVPQTVGGSTVHGAQRCEGVIA